MNPSRSSSSKNSTGSRIPILSRRVSSSIGKKIGDPIDIGKTPDLSKFMSPVPSLRSQVSKKSGISKVDAVIDEDRVYMDSSMRSTKGKSRPKFHNNLDLQIDVDASPIVSKSSVKKPLKKSTQDSDKERGKDNTNDIMINVLDQQLSLAKAPGPLNAHQSDLRLSFNSPGLMTPDQSMSVQNSIDVSNSKNASNPPNTNATPTGVYGSVDLSTPHNKHAKTAAEIDALLETSSHEMAYPLKRLDKLGKGSSSYVYRTIMLDELTVCAEKVVIVNDIMKKIQILRELEILRKALTKETKKYQLRRSQQQSESINQLQYRIDKKQSEEMERLKMEEEKEAAKKAKAEALAKNGIVLPSHEVGEEEKGEHHDDAKEEEDNNNSSNHKDGEGDKGNRDGEEGEDEDEKDMSIDEMSAVIQNIQNIPDGSAHVVGLHGVVPNPLDGTLSICLEYMNGGSLQDIVNDGGVGGDESILKGIALQVVSGLDFLHGMRVIHRDLKPSNCLINSQGIVKLADFGMARVLDNNNSFAESFLGTYEYMAPERVSGSPYTFASDVWSLGLTLHAIAIGGYPYNQYIDDDKSKGKRKSKGASNKNSSHSNKGTKLDYWTLVHYMQDQPAPLPSESIYSPEFISFIAGACEKNSKNRSSAANLLDHIFLNNAQIPNYNNEAATILMERRIKRQKRQAARRKGQIEDDSDDDDEEEDEEEEDIGSDTRVGKHLMSAAEAGFIASSWATYAAQHFVKSLTDDELVNTNNKYLSPDERILVKKLTRSQDFLSKDNKSVSLLSHLSDTSLSAAKITQLAYDIGCSEPVLRTAFHAAIGDLRLLAMLGVAKSGNEINVDAHTLSIQDHYGTAASRLKELVNQEIEEEDEDSEDDDPIAIIKHKEKEEEIDTDDENMMFSDNDAVSTTSSEESSDEEEARQDQLEMGAQIYADLMAAGGDGLTLPPVNEPRRR
jgi:serine/threonine protein kinase